MSLTEAACCNVLLLFHHFDVLRSLFAFLLSSNLIIPTWMSLIAAWKDMPWLVRFGKVTHLKSSKVIISLVDVLVILKLTGFIYVKFPVDGDISDIGITYLCSVP